MSSEPCLRNGSEVILGVTVPEDINQVNFAYLSKLDPDDTDGSRAVRTAPRVLVLTYFAAPILPWSTMPGSLYQRVKNSSAVPGKMPPFTFIQVS